MNAIDKARNQGVPIYAGRTDYRCPCPSCSPKRRKSKDPCLHVTIGSGRVDWYCHHCGPGNGFKGTTTDDDWRGPTGPNRARYSEAPARRRRWW